MNLIIPAQIRAGRALIGWSQDQLANAAKVALSSVRDVENHKRASESEVISSIRRTLENEGVVFVYGNENSGPGVHLVANRPNIIRRPTTITAWDGLPFTVEWQGKEITVLISEEVIEDLGHFSEKQPDEWYIEVFDKHRAIILDAVAQAITDTNNFDRSNRLHVRSKDFPDSTFQ
ncbi:MAG: DUF1488 family protein [Pseudomonadota bacterium]